jgi:hypothetical protein
MSAIATIPVSNKTMMSTADIFSDPAVFEHFQRVAKVFASSNLVPQHLRGNVADCVIALAIARRLDEDPLTVFQSIYIVNGKPGWLTSYMIARVNRARVFRSPITWDETGSGDSLTVTAKAIIADSGEEVKTSVDMRMATAEGWTKNPKYKSMGAHMLKWRSAAMLIRLYCPEIMFGMPVVEELETMPPAIRDITPAGERMRKTLDDFANSGKTDDEPEQEAVAQESCLAPPVPGQGAPDTNSPLTTSGAPAATTSAEENVAEVAPEKAEIRAKPMKGK